MAKKKKHQGPVIGQELRSLFFGGILLFLSALVAFGDASSLVGGAMDRALTSMLGQYYRAFFVPIVTAIGAMIALNRLSWNMARFFGLLLFWISVTSLSEAWNPTNWNGYFDLFDISKDLFGRLPAIIFLVVLLLVSLYLTLRISYRKVISHIHSRLPSVESVR